jgi:hypothetical protein
MQLRRDQFRGAAPGCCPHIVRTSSVPTKAARRDASIQRFDDGFFRNPQNQGPYGALGTTFALSSIKCASRVPAWRSGVWSERGSP